MRVHRTNFRIGLLAAALAAIGGGPLRAQNKQFVLSDTQFNQWVFRGDRPQDDADSEIAIALEAITRCCRLTAAQQEKLRLAGRGDFARFDQQLYELRQELVDKSYDQNEVNKVYQKIRPLATIYQAGLLGPSSLFAKVVRETLTPEQTEEYEAEQTARRQARHADKVQLFVALLERSCPLSDKQRTALVELLLAETKPPTRSGVYDWYVVPVQVAVIPQEKLQAILDDAQMRVLNKSLERYRGIEQLLKQRGDPGMNRCQAVLSSLACAILLGGGAAPAGAQIMIEHVGEAVPRDVREMYDRGLEYLVKTQSEQGDWESGGQQGPGITGMALMVFLASGEDPNFGLYSNQVRKAVRSIIRGQNATTGFFGNSMYHHGFATLALAEAYGVVDDRNLWPAGEKQVRTIGQALELAVRAAITSQKKNSFGGWRYSPDSNDADTSVSGAVLVGLLAARNAGIDVPDEVIDRAISYYQSMTSDSGQVAYSGGMGGFDESMARISISSLVYSIARRKDLPQYKSTLGYLKQRIEQPANRYREYTNYYEAQALFQGDVAAWEKWNKLLVRQLKERQQPDGSFNGDFGPHVSTSLSLLGVGRQLPLPADLRALK